jgi:hypothetical protein
MKRSSSSVVEEKTGKLGFQIQDKKDLFKNLFVSFHDSSILSDASKVLRIYLTRAFRTKEIIKKFRKFPE